MFDKLNLKRKIIVTITGVVVTAVMCVIGTSTLTSQRALEEGAQQFLNQTAELNGEKTRIILNRTIQVANTLTSTLRSLHSSGVENREVFDQLLRDTLESHPELIGVWTGWEPNALDGRDTDFSNTPGHDASGRYIPYWVRSGTEIMVEPLLSYDVPGDGDYYQLPLTTGKAIILDPYSYPINGVDTLITSVAVPIQIDGKVVGVAGVDVAMSEIQQLLGQKKPLGNGFLTLLSGGKYIVAHKDSNLLGKSGPANGFSSQSIQQARSQKLVVEAKNLDTATNIENIRVYKSLPLDLIDNNWTLVVSVPKSSAFTAMNNSWNMQLMIAAICIAAAFAIAYFFAVRISQPITRITKDMKTLAEGNLEVELPDMRRSDEIGDMARTVAIFQKNAVERQQLAKEAETNQHSQQKRQHTINHLIETFDSSIQQALKTVGSNSKEMQETAEFLTAIASNTSEQATSAANASGETSTNVQTVASAAEELAASIEEIRRQVSDTKEIADSATSSAISTNQKVSGLDAAAEKIGEVVNLIQDIAEQTNLLALNATIEAARAGEMGKGFAVVAAEVKGLATQTSKATEQIAQQVSEIQSSTKDAVSAIDEIASTMHRVNEYTTAIAAAVDQQGLATQEISRSVQHAATGTQDVADNITGVTKSIIETNSSAKLVLDASQAVAVETNELKNTVSTFLSEVRRA